VATVDQKMLTGEPIPVVKRPGDQVQAGTVVTEGKLSLRAERPWAESTTARVIGLILDAPVNETRIQRYGELFADRVVPWSFLGAGVTLLRTGRLDAAAALLMIDFGTGIRIAASTTVLAAMIEAAREGILIKGGRHLERLAEVDAVIFDKTGTLTLGAPEVVAVVPHGGRYAHEEILALAAAAEDRLTHPVALAIVAEALRRGIAIPPRHDFEYAIGLGVRATVGGSVVLVGSRRFLEVSGVATEDGPERPAGTQDPTTSRMFVAVSGELAGQVVYRDTLRPEAPGVVRALRARGIEQILMVTGDNAAVAEAVAERVGITRVVARALPEQKVAIVQSLQRQGRTVAVIGDGINDSPGLTRADVGIAIHGGSDVARETADVALLEESLWKIPRSIDLARQAMHLVRQNWAVNFYPNCTAVVLTLLGLSGPIATTLIHNGSALASTLNALRPLLARSSARCSGHGAPRPEGGSLPGPPGPARRHTPGPG
jgi:heavy metal translocating P-type ATPase